ncbi:SDR family NAD(P)-dependent oxidoreductase [Propionibacterium australiense]|uniref:SDR family oxidoreductase n=1 Tax=Propionibacterium australiense TaxID=119981 RepID=A0A383S645_9ACTN|nr:SDR family oxidoreductase [Propionibacterium australiense]RLP08966.1 SDR family oxidoreductase [Propionibacterium australiense]RLP09101.1 SDR family oxidoreductase [Propionibacterium australiense]SYZ33475.1 Short-chain dehydrogenase/reductase SDR [Propionibacterium australiense]VEH91769.1 3-oxoacyl-[acyl-carrier-protein] reductase FabG [Propionibacterium australiense]
MKEYEKAVFPERHTAVVSGAGAPRGIARKAAHRLAAEGWDVVVVDLSDKVLEFGEELTSEYPERKFLAIQLDISDEEQVKDAFTRIKAEMPPVVGLANIAGIACPVPLLELDAALFDKVLAVNCRGTMLMMKYAAEQMKEHGIGRIVNFSSITALDGGGTFSKFAYAAAKAGVLGITKGGARELGPYGITTNAVLPGPIDTDIMGGKLTDERKEQMSSNIPVGRVGQPEEIAAVVSFLLSADASFVNGVSLNVDGGKQMH